MASTQIHPPGTLTASHRLKSTYTVLIFLGLLASGLLMMRDAERVWHGYVVAYFYFTSLALGGLFFVAIHHVSKAGWSVNVRRLSESFTAFLPWAAIGGVGLIIGAPKLYTWLQPEVVAQDALLQHKQGYLNQTFFIIRMVVFFGLWLWFARVLVGRSLNQDQTGDSSLTVKSVGTSIAFILVFALSYSFFSVDLLMSLEPHWFSTIFGVYCFAGLFQSTMASMILLIIYLKRKGKLEGYVDENHLHDLGKYLFAFTVFWAYIAFSQYMLIWYANLPEETFFYLPRLEPGWLWVSISLLVFKFIVPFFALLPRWAKRTPAHLVVVCCLILVMQYVDLYWLVFPNFNEEHAVFGVSEIGTFLLFAGLFLMSVVRFLGQNQLVPVKDPRIEESLHHHVVY